MTLKRKIILRMYALTFLIVVAMSVTYYYLFTRDIRERSHQNLEMVYTVIFDDFETRIEAALPKIDHFIGTSLVNPLYVLQMLREQQEPGQAISVWYVKRMMTYLHAISNNMRDFGSLLEAAEITVYNNQRDLLAMYRHEGEQQVTGGYLAQVNQGTFLFIHPDDKWHVMLQQVEEVPWDAVPDELALQYEGTIPDSPMVTFSTFHDLVTIQFRVPVVNQGEFEGVCVIHLGIRQQDIERYARLSGTRVNVFRGLKLSAGTLPEYHTLPNNLTLTRRQIDLLKLSGLPPVDFSEMTARGNSYYQGTLALEDEAGSQVTITAHFPRALEEQQKTKFFIVVAGIAFVFSMLAIMEAIGLSTVIVRPISHLMEAMQSMKRGNWDIQAPVETQDEIGRLAETFNAMSAQLKANFAKIEEQRQRVERQNQELQQLDQLKDEFLSNTSHELRTPLNGIAGLAQAILSGADGPLTDNERKHVRMILQSSKRLTNLVNSLLDFSKIKSQRLQLHLKPFPVAEVSDLVCTFAASLVQGKPVKLLADIPANLPEVYGDMDKVEQILTNLVGNAIKFTREGTISISARQDGEWVRVEVQDTGIGIPAEALERIFKPFEQVDGSVTREFGGTGLGLSITKELVELHGGRITVESEPGAGSVFAFTLSCQEGQAAASWSGLSDRSDLSDLSDIGEAPEEAPYTGPIVSGTGKTLLIIDDDPTNVESLRTQLEYAGFAVITVSNGHEAFEIINGDHVDLILCDVVMPLVDGYTFAMRMRERKRLKNIPLVFVSAKDQPLDKLRGYQAGGVDYLTRPVEIDELLCKINAILHLHHPSEGAGTVNTRDTVYATEQDKEEAYAAIRRGNGEKILVVDDEPINIEVYKTHLTQYHYKVITASDGLEALDQIDRHRPDLVLLDLMMPKMSGFRVCKIIREEKGLKDLPVIMLTAKSNIYDKVYGLNIGANDYIVKPFNVEELLTRIYVLLSISELQQSLVATNEILQQEIVERKQAEEALRRLNEELELRVEERTVELQMSLDHLNQAQEQLVQSEKMAALGALVAGVAHEVNTPLGVGVTAASHLNIKTREIRSLYDANKITRSSLDQYLKIASDSSTMILKNLQRAAEQIQSFRQVAVDQRSEKRRRFRVKMYLEEILFSLNPAIRQAHHRISLEGDDAIEMDSYPGALSQVITALVMNSLQHAYSDGQSGRLSFSLLQERDWLLLEYSDDGRGILPEHLPRIFDPFFTTARSAGGSGLGLHIVYNLVTHKLRGHISCESVPGEGAAFLLNLPLSG